MSQQSASNLKAAKVTVSAENSANSGNDHPIPELVALPDVPLQAVISYIPLQSLITTGPLLHSRLSTFREIALRQNRHLTLTIGSGEDIWSLERAPFPSLPLQGHLIDLTTEKPLHPEPNTFHHLYLDSLELSTVQQLTSHMPAISHLEVFIYVTDAHHIHHLINLLTLWSSTLISLKFHVKFSPWADLGPGKDYYIRRSIIGSLLLHLLDSINTLSLSSLTHLTLDLQDCLFELNQKTPTLAMPILGQLEEFYIQTEDHQEFIVETLRNYAKKSLQVVGIGLPGTRTSYLEAFPAGTHLPSAFVALAPNTISNADFSLYSTEARKAHFLREARFLSTFINLREYTVQLFPSRPLSALPALLSPLHQLTSLTLDVNFSKALSLIKLPNWRLTLAPLGSVQILTIALLDYAPRHTDTVSPLWGHLFPSVQILLFHHFTDGDFCRACHPYEEYSEPITDDNVDTYLPCIEKYLAPLTVLPKLRKMFFQEEYEGNFAEFNSTGDFVQIIDDLEIQDE